jgi:prepilin-type N-terminal cleavage/methylation domain-containing protein
MEMSTSSTRRRRFEQSGFTLLETLIAITVLAVGMLGVAAMLCNMDSNTGRSRYMSIAALLASEKLEELNRFPATDDNIQVSSGVMAGSLAADSSAGSVNYFDQIAISSGNGSIAETTTQVDGSGTTVYSTTSQSPNGEVITTTSSAPPTSPDMLQFKRRWLIEKDVPVAGVCRITVLVTLTNISSKTPVDFRMSMVRQYAN